VPLDCKASDTDSDNQKELNSPLCYSEAELGPAIDPLSCEKESTSGEEKSFPSRDDAEVLTVDAGSEVDKKVTWKTTVEMLKTPTVILTLLQAAPGALPFGFISVFLNDYLSEDRGMSTQVRTKSTSVI